jgi:hypothetical protein
LSATAFSKLYFRPSYLISHHNMLWLEGNYSASFTSSSSHRHCLSRPFAATSICILSSHFCLHVFSSTQRPRPAAN